MTTFRGRRARQELAPYKQEETEAGKKTRRRSAKRLIRAGEFMPVIIKDYSDGIPTSNGKEMSSYVLEHLISGENITATVFENEAPNYIDEKILDAVLPEDLEEFNVEDLVNCGFFVKVKFNEKNGRTFTNIVDAEPLDEDALELLGQKVEALTNEKQRLSKEIRESVDKLSDMHRYNSSNSLSMKEVSMEEMGESDPYTQKVINQGVEDSESTQPDRRRKSQLKSQVTEEDADDLDLEEYDDGLDLNLNDVYLCKECQDAGCKECNDLYNSAEDEDEDEDDDEF